MIFRQRKLVWGDGVFLQLINQLIKYQLEYLRTSSSYVPSGYVIEKNENYKCITVINVFNSGYLAHFVLQC